MRADAEDARPVLRHETRRHGAQDQSGPEGALSVQARCALRHQGRRDRHRGRVPRQTDVRPPFLRRSASGHRGQGARQSRQGKPDSGHDHDPELLPHVQEAGENYLQNQKKKTNDIYNIKFNDGKTTELSKDTLRLITENEENNIQEDNKKLDKTFNSFSRTRNELIEYFKNFQTKHFRSYSDNIH